MEIPALADLLDLQEVDTAIDRLLDERQHLPALQRYRDASKASAAVTVEHESVSSQLRSTELDLDKSEGELEITEIKLSETETRLYSGGMNARETENKRLEVQNLKDRQGHMEETVLELLTTREELQAQVEARSAEVEEAKRVEADLEQQITAAWKEIDLRIGRHEERKRQIVEGIPQELIDRYEKLRRTKEGVAIGRLEHGQCGGCHLTLSASEQKDAQESDPPLCVHCRRMLVL